MIVLAALALGIALGPYHGPPLSGSVPGTAKIGVALSGTPGARVRLHVGGLPKGWIASFCTDRVCAPFKVGLVLPATGRQLIELQVIANDERAPAPRTIVVRSADGARASIPFRSATR